MFIVSEWHDITKRVFRLSLEVQNLDCVNILANFSKQLGLAKKKLWPLNFDGLWRFY